MAIEVNYKIGDNVKIISLAFEGRGEIPDSCLGKIVTIVDIREGRSLPNRVRIDGQTWDFPSHAIQPMGTTQRSSSYDDMMEKYTRKFLFGTAPTGDFYGKSWFETAMGSTLDIPKFNHSIGDNIMSSLQSIPVRLKRILNANYRAFYKLGWVDEDLDVTSSGREALIDMLFDLHEKELGVIATKRVAELKKEESEE